MPITFPSGRTADEVTDPAMIAALTRELGLDRPLTEQYFGWLGRVLQGDFGLSFTTKTPVDVMFLHALGVSLLHVLRHPLDAAGVAPWNTAA